MLIFSTLLFSRSDAAGQLIIPLPRFPPEPFSGRPVNRSWVTGLLRYEHFGEIGFGDPKREEGSNQ